MHRQIIGFRPAHPPSFRPRNPAVSARSSRLTRPVNRTARPICGARPFGRGYRDNPLEHTAEALWPDCQGEPALLYNISCHSLLEYRFYRIFKSQSRHVTPFYSMQAAWQSAGPAWSKTSVNLNLWHMILTASICFSIIIRVFCPMRKYIGGQLQ